MPDDLSAAFADGDLLEMRDDVLHLAVRYFTAAISADLPHLPNDQAREAALLCLDEVAARCAERGESAREVAARIQQVGIARGSRRARAAEEIECFLVSNDASARSMATHHLLTQLANVDDLDDVRHRRAVQIGTAWLATHPPEQSATAVLAALDEIDGYCHWELLESDLTRTGAAVLAASAADARVQRMAAYLDLLERLADLPTEEHGRDGWAAQHQRAASAIVSDWPRTYEEVDLVLEHPWFSMERAYSDQAGPSGRASDIFAGWRRAEHAVMALGAYDLPDDELDDELDALDAELDRYHSAEQVRSQLEAAASQFERGCAALASEEDQVRLKVRFIDNLLLHLGPEHPELLDSVLSVALDLSERFGVPLSVDGLDEYVKARGIAAHLENIGLGPEDELPPRDPKAALLAAIFDEPDPLDELRRRTAHLDLTDEELELCLRTRSVATEELSDDTVDAVRSAIDVRINAGTADALRERLRHLRDPDGLPLFRWQAEVDFACIRLGIGDQEQAARDAVPSVVMAGLTDRPVIKDDLYAGLELLEQRGFDVPTLIIESLQQITDPRHLSPEGCADFAGAIALLASTSGTGEQRVWQAMGNTVRRLDEADPGLDLVTRYRDALISEERLRMGDGRSVLDFDAEHCASWSRLGDAPWSWSRTTSLVASGALAEALAGLLDRQPIHDELSGFVRLLIAAKVEVPLPARSTAAVEFQHPGGAFRQPRLARRTTRSGHHLVKGSEGARLPAPPPHHRRTNGLNKPGNHMGPSL